MISLKMIPPTSKFQQRLFEIASDYEVAKTTASLPHPYTLEYAQQYLESIQKPSKLYKTLGIFRDSTLVGIIETAPDNLEEEDVSRIALSYWITQEYWSQGITTQALRMLLKHLRSQRSPQQKIVIAAEFMESNPASAKVLKKNGFKQVAQLSKVCRESETQVLRFERSID